MTLHPSQLEPIQAAIRKGQLIIAIKLYREATGVGLKEAKDAVEAMQAGKLVSSPAAAAPPPADEATRPPAAAPAPAAPAPTRTELPARCPGCDAPLGASIRWVTAFTAECPGCGRLLRPA